MCISIHIDRPCVVIEIRCTGSEVVQASAPSGLASELLEAAVPMRPASSRLARRKRGTRLCEPKTTTLARAGLSQVLPTNYYRSL